MAAISELGYIGTHSTDGSECLGSYSTTSPSSGLFLGDDDDELDDAMVQVSQKHRSASKRTKLNQYQVGRVLEVGAAHLTKFAHITWSLEAHFDNGVINPTMCSAASSSSSGSGKALAKIIPPPSFHTNEKYM